MHILWGLTRAKGVGLEGTGVCLLTIDFWHYVHYVIAFSQVPGQNAKEHIPGIFTLRTNQFAVINTDFPEERST